jgi:hypothetical protein
MYLYPTGMNTIDMSRCSFLQYSHNAIACMKVANRIGTT